MRKQLIIALMLGFGLSARAALFTNIYFPGAWPADQWWTNTSPPTSIVTSNAWYAENENWRRASNSFLWLEAQTNISQANHASGLWDDYHHLDALTVTGDDAPNPTINAVSGYVLHVPGGIVGNVTGNVSGSAATATSSTNLGGATNHVSGNVGVEGNVTVSGTVSGGALSGPIRNTNVIGTQYSVPFLSDYRDPGSDGNNVFVGPNAGNFTMTYGGGPTTLASYNLAVGESAFHNNVSGNECTAIGRMAMYYNTIGQNVTALGEDSCFSNTVAFNNVGLGQKTLFSNMVGSNNTAVGTIALFRNTNNNSTAVGASALYNSTSQENTAVGQYSLYNLTSGTDNTAIGQNTGSALTTGSFCTLLGQGANVALASIRNATAIGAGAKATNYNDFVLGTSAEKVIVPGSLWSLGNFTNSGATYFGSLQQASISSSGVVTADGSGLTALNGANISSGTIASARLPQMSSAVGGTMNNQNCSTTQRYSAFIGGGLGSSAVTVVYSMIPYNCILTNLYVNVYGLLPTTNCTIYVYTNGANTPLTCATVGTGAATVFTNDLIHSVYVSAGTPIALAYVGNNATLASPTPVINWSVQLIQQ